MSDNHKSASGARDAAVANAMRELEGDICAVLTVARILAELLDNDLVGFENGQKIQMPSKGKPMKVYLSADQMEMLSFAWNDVIDRAAKLKMKFYAAHDAGVTA